MDIIDPYKLCSVENSGDSWDVIVHRADGTEYVIEAVHDKEDAEEVANQLRIAVLSWLSAS